MCNLAINPPRIPEFFSLHQTIYPRRFFFLFFSSDKAVRVISHDPLRDLRINRGEGGKGGHTMDVR